MSKNRLHEPFLLCIIVIASLLVLSVVPPFSLESITFQKINLLADIVVEPIDPDEAAFKDSLVAKQDSVIQLVKESCRPGITCIEDYSGDSTALFKFYRSLSVSGKSPAPLRIAFYGDSFIEGDVFCGSFRDSLQSLFGGRGVGFVPITSGVAGFRNTIKHSFDNWSTSSVIGRTDSTAEYGPAGYCFVPLDGNWVEYRPAKKRFLQEFNTVKLYYKNHRPAAVRFKINNDTLERVSALRRSAHLQEWVYHGKKLKSIKFTFQPFDSLRLFGASFEDGPGVYVDNFSLRGNSGISLAGISNKMLVRFNSYRHYKLVILQFGLNMVVEDSLNYKSYVRRMVRVIRKLQSSFPEASFLLMSVSDRSSNSKGQFETMNAIPAMRNAQRMIAQETKIAFWDLFQAMGGENSMVKFVTSKPALAAKDYTHLNFNGGKKLAGSLVKSLLYGHERHQKKYVRKRSNKK
jgi:lysophospholipase L1-like esterase